MMGYSSTATTPQSGRTVWPVAGCRSAGRHVRIRRSRVCPRNRHPEVLAAIRVAPRLARGFCALVTISRICPDAEQRRHPPVRALAPNFASACRCSQQVTDGTRCSDVDLQIVLTFRFQPRCGMSRGSRLESGSGPAGEIHGLRAHRRVMVDDEAGAGQRRRMMGRKSTRKRGAVTTAGTPTRFNGLGSARRRLEQAVVQSRDRCRPPT